jgi:uncharacterized repeat protein (TIGR01451 family)
VGDTITYTVSLSNLGPDDATNVRVSDPLSSGLTFVSDTASVGTYDSATGLWTVGTVTTTTSETLTITAVITSPNAQTNTASISHADQFDPNTSNNTASATVTPQSPSPPPETADVSLTKQVNQASPIFGTPVTYTLTAHNNGPAAATGVVATDTMPPGLMVLTATPSQGSFDAVSGRWAVGTLASGATATLQITGLVVVIGPVTNTASVTALQADPDLTNNVSSAAADVLFAGGLLSKRQFLASSDPAVAGILSLELTALNADMTLIASLWNELWQVAQNLLAARNDPGPGNGGVAVFEGTWLGSPWVVYADPLGVTAEQVGPFDFLYRDNSVVGVQLL